MKYFSTFSGAGGFELGIERAYANQKLCDKDESVCRSASETRSSEGQPEQLSQQRMEGLACVGFSEIDKYASAVLKHNYPEVKNYGDISKIKWAEVPDFDLLTGGSPCQDFSLAGKREGLDGERSGLFHEFLRALEGKQPKYFIWENVKGVLSSRSGWDFANIQVAFSEAGYSLWWQVLNAKDFGVPQNRERIFVVGTREGSPREILFETSYREKHLGSDGQGNAYCLQAGGDKHRGTYVAPNGKKIDLTDAPDRPFQLSETRTEEGKKSRREIRQKEGRDSTLRSKEHKKYIPNPKDAANCLTTSEHDIFKWTFKESRIRKLTPTECMRLMSWPDSWCDYGDFDGEIKEISDSQKYRMAGNGVVSNCVEAIIREMIIKNPN